MVGWLVLACEVAFWVLLVAGLGLRYLLRMPRTGAALLLCEPLLELVLLAATVIDLRNGAEPQWYHGLAALYIGYTVAYGHYTVTWLDGHARHRFGDGTPPVRPPRYGTARAAHEGRLWLRTVLLAAVASGLLLLGTWYVGDAERSAPLTGAIRLAWRVAGIHGLIALSYAVLPRRAPAGEEREKALAGHRWPH
ncbi:hypothetical protein [Streptomyces sp. NPDC060194]|uniref:hypothetical protein n=1 Tax=Streptomyces sp. NPDC060194 TaxID=3347069 RepID=UPI0036631EE8